MYSSMYANMVWKYMKRVLANTVRNFFASGFGESGDEFFVCSKSSLVELLKRLERESMSTTRIFVCTKKVADSFDVQEY